MNNQGQFNNPMNAMLQFINNGGNAQQLVQNQIANNPQLNSAYQQIKGMMSASKMSSKDFAMQYFNNLGIEPKQVEMLAKKMGIK
jgi:hypothetical protein